MATPAPGESIQKEIETFFQAANDARVVGYCDIAALAWLVYDMILTFPQERRLIWTAKSSLNKWLFLSLRYFAPLDLAFTVAVDTNYHVKYHPALCSAIIWYKALVALILPTFLAEGLIIMRVYALYPRNRRVRAFLALLYIIRFGVALFACTAEALSVRVPTYTYVVPIPGCLGDNVQHLYYSLIPGAVNLAVAFTLFLLTWHRLMRHGEAIGASGVRGIGQRVPLAHLLARDGTLYFLMVLACEVCFNILMFGYESRLLKLAGFPWMLTVYAIAATRITLNLRASVVGPELALTVTEVQRRHRAPRFTPPTLLSMDTDTTYVASDAYEFSPMKAKFGRARGQMAVFVEQQTTTDTVPSVLDIRPGSTSDGVSYPFVGYSYPSA